MEEAGEVLGAGAWAVDWWADEGRAVLCPQWWRVQTRGAQMKTAKAPRSWNYRGGGYMPLLGQANRQKHCICIMLIFSRHKKKRCHCQWCDGNKKQYQFVSVATPWIQSSLIAKAIKQCRYFYQHACIIPVCVRSNVKHIHAKSCNVKESDI